MAVYNNQERPFPLTNGDPYHESVHPMLKSLHQKNSPVGDAFFTSSNTERIQVLLRQAIRRLTGYRIDRQSVEQLMWIMRNVYYTEHNSQPMSIKDEVERLNTMVVSEAVPIVSSALAGFLAYLRDASQIAPPVARGLNTSIKGTRQLQSKAWLQ